MLRVEEPVDRLFSLLRPLHPPPSCPTQTKQKTQGPSAMTPSRAVDAGHWAASWIRVWARRINTGRHRTCRELGRYSTEPCLSGLPLLGYVKLTRGPPGKGHVSGT